MLKVSASKFTLTTYSILVFDSDVWKPKQNHPGLHECTFQQASQVCVQSLIYSVCVSSGSRSTWSR